MLFFKKKDKEESQVKEPKPKNGFYFSRENIYKRLAEKSQHKVEEIQEYLDSIGWDDDACDFDTKKYEAYLTEKYGKHEPDEEIVYTEVPNEEEDGYCDCEHCTNHDLSNIETKISEEDVDSDESDEIEEDEIDKIISDDFKTVEDPKEEDLDPDDIMGRVIVNERKKMEAEVIDDEDNSSDETTEIVDKTDKEKINNIPTGASHKITVVKNNKNNSKKIIISTNKSKIRYIRGDEMKIAISALNEYTTASDLIKKLNDQNLGIVQDADGDCISRSGITAFHIEDEKVNQFILKGKLVMSNPNLSNQFYRNICTELGIKVHSQFKTLTGTTGKTFMSKTNSGEVIGMNISVTNGFIVIICEFDIVNEEDIN